MPVQPQHLGRAKEYRKNVSKRFNRTVDKFVREIEASGSKVAGAYIDEMIEKVKDESLKIAPVKTGELINSIVVEKYANTKHADSSSRIASMIRYDAKHSGFAHDNAGRGHDYKNPTKPGTHWHFLTDPAKKVLDDIKFDKATIKKDIVNAFNKMKLKRAWAEARIAADKFGGTASQYISSLMKGDQ